MTCPVVAFFDVDETLIASKSMFAVMRFYLEQTEGKAGLERFEVRLRCLRRLTAMGAPRVVINRLYYFFWRGTSANAVATAAAEWVVLRTTEPNFFLRPTVAALAMHRQRGDRIVLVSGSFPAVLEPLRIQLGADDLLCTRPRIVNGRLTGWVEQPMIGANKARAARYLMARGGINPLACAAYGDHLSDLPLLELVGHPGVVPHDPSLVAIARARNWRILT
ncbi:HAD family hydrolase [Verminephrobacter aporrectodeae]|uniref:HAD family hydrolase n=1 Tax=Verminephrobacter aporrectodeae TaxID=1110389 RepID=UPI002237BE47|nr:HAD-IB family hydrolase [Verminephrobacter aporrectodeae]